jgi:hypothetical protein
MGGIITASHGCSSENIHPHPTDASTVMPQLQNHLHHLMYWNRFYNACSAINITVAPACFFTLTMDEVSMLSAADAHAEAICCTRDVDCLDLVREPNPSVELFIHFMSGNTLLARVSCTSTLDRALKHVATSLNRKLGPDGDEGVEWYQLHCFDIEGQEIPNNAVVGELPKRVCDGIQVIVDADDMPALLDLDADDNGSGLPEDLSCDVEWLT